MEQSNDAPARPVDILDTPLTLTQSQMQWLARQLSSDDNEIVKAASKQCAREMFFKRSCKLISLLRSLSIYFSSGDCAPVGLVVSCKTKIAERVSTWSEERCHIFLLGRNCDIVSLGCVHIVFVLRTSPAVVYGAVQEGKRHLTISLHVCNFSTINKLRENRDTRTRR